MKTSSVAHHRPSNDTGFNLSPQQVAYFRTFGFLKLPGLFAAEIGEISAAFDEVFAGVQTDRLETHEDIHGNELRDIIVRFISKDERLARLQYDPRVVGVVRGLIDEGFEYAESDGSQFSCNSNWHLDFYGAPIEHYHIKLSFYLDPLRRESGAIRMIPGTNFHDESFAQRLRTDLWDHKRIQEIYGVEPSDIPSYTLETNPGDLVVWNFRTIHASYGGRVRRRLFSINFREGSAPDPSPGS